MNSANSTPTHKSRTATTEGHTTAARHTSDTSRSSPETTSHTPSKAQARKAHKGQPPFDHKRQREVNERLNAALGVKHGN